MINRTQKKYEIFYTGFVEFFGEAVGLSNEALSKKWNMKDGVHFPKPDDATDNLYVRLAQSLDGLIPYSTADGKHIRGFLFNKTLDKKISEKLDLLDASAANENEIKPLLENALSNARLVTLEDFFSYYENVLNVIPSLTPAERTDLTSSLEMIKQNVNPNNFAEQKVLLGNEIIKFYDLLAKKNIAFEEDKWSYEPIISLLNLIKNIPIPANEKLNAEKYNTRLLKAFRDHPDLPTIRTRIKACDDYLLHLNQSKNQCAFFKSENADKKIKIVTALRATLMDDNEDASKRVRNFDNALREKKNDFIALLSKSRDSYLVAFLKGLGLVGAVILVFATLGVAESFSKRIMNEKLLRVHGKDFVNEVAKNKYGFSDLVLYERKTLSK